MATYRLRVITPDRTVFDQRVNEIITRSVEGELGILAHHLPIITPLAPHALTIYLEDGGTERVAISGGFLEVGRDEVVILADTAELPHEIDRERAEAARARAEDLLSRGGPDVDLPRAQRALARALSRLDAANAVVR